MAQGTPIFAYNEGGVTETVLENVCGKFFKNNDELTVLLKDYNKKEYNAQRIINRAREFTEEKFLDNLKQYFKQIHEKETE